MSTESASQAKWCSNAKCQSETHQCDDASVQFRGMQLILVVLWINQRPCYKEDFRRSQITLPNSWLSVFPCPSAGSCWRDLWPWSSSRRPETDDDDWHQAETTTLKYHAWGLGRKTIQFQNRTINYSHPEWVTFLPRSTRIFEIVPWAVQQENEASAQFSSRAHYSLRYGTPPSSLQRITGTLW